MKRSFLPRKPVVLSESTQRRLVMYALAAGATAVGGLAVTRPAEAKIIYTPAHVVMNFPDGMHCVDMNHDGKNDFCLWFSRSTYGACFLQASGRSYNQVGGIAATGPGRGLGAIPIRAGGKIGGSRTFVNSFYGPSMVRFQGVCSDLTWGGAWIVGGKGNKGLHNRYLGIRFGTNGNVHYGWARCSVYPPSTSFLRVEMTGYAYETIPNKPIIAGKTKGQDVITLPIDTHPGTLGHLAAGASAIPAWRLKQTAATH